MYKKVLWSIITCLMLVSLIVSSCASRDKAQEQPGPSVTESDTPQYGGVLNLIQQFEPGGFDTRVTMNHFTRTLPITHELLLTGDWTKGPAGTGETDWQRGFMGRTDLFTGSLAESWELVGNDTIIYHIRKGVKWHNKYPLFGSAGEINAHDIAWNIEMDWRTPGMNLDVFFKKADHLLTVEAIDDYTVKLTFPPHALAVHVMENSCRIFMLPPEITEKYENQSDWRHSTGTGPYMLKDYVVGSHIEYEKNPDYYLTDPIGPGQGNKLPYMDGIVELIIPDISTQMAAIRTGKVDCTRGLTISWENGESLLRQSPQIQYVKTLAGNLVPTGRVDKDLPFSDIRVRQALNLAVNQQEILDGYRRGNGVLLGYPFYDVPAHERFFVSFEDMPDTPVEPGSRCSVKELFSYNPEKAKELLTEAGYPNGFKTTIVTSAADADFLAMVREYLLKVGVDMQIQTLETGVFNSVRGGRTHDEMIISPTHLHWAPWLMHEVRVDSAGCLSFWESEKTRQVYNLISRNLGLDNDLWTNALREIVPHILENAWGIWMPVPHTYIMWWPWLKNFNGETHVGYVQWYEFTKYSWIDTNLKRSMGY